MQPSPPPLGPVAWHRFATLADASEALAEAVAIRLRALLAAQGSASLAVPGGTTPARFLAALGTRDLAWERVTLLPTDERFVAADDAASNERMMRAQFAPLREGRVRFLSFHDRGSDIEVAAVALASELSTLPPLDLVVSGMGADGHIASLFPGEEASFGAQPDSGVCIATPPGLPPRLSLSPARLVGTGWASLLVSGSEKEAVLKAAPDRASPLPVDLLLDRPQGLDVYWAKE
ncbi:MAG: 6-phosphogluconolactonase [Bosea sp. (in: a-proteobacteria)]|uniref:6-phosphogluconolactonase n=1 Tax=Bosea sp. (in: a-proteobacteria) TaxID=1871050 RepID=UPI0027353B07|nr:6-phosphogluconolactonase [Bosea sp. (in: a-proteobacteria)]MDP3256106.1 6-phosphogluconolactonase [Bosea sp. (in: a-proteobacteria)]MDP3318832.1 6-phosphogluconolactonase [Bosea sp. (in: a-proteobacteria)]